jgi:hypothetical protein
MHVSETGIISILKCKGGNYPTQVSLLEAGLSHFPLNVMMEMGQVSKILFTSGNAWRCSGGNFETRNCWPA